jgi:hypothetical protein
MTRSFREPCAPPPHKPPTIPVFVADGRPQIAYRAGNGQRCTLFWESGRL